MISGGSPLHANFKAWCFKAVARDIGMCRPTLTYGKAMI